VKQIPLQILGTGEFVPSNHVDSEAFDRTFDRSLGWTFEQTGVRRRAHASPQEHVVSMGAAAARQALCSAGIAGEKLDLIVSVGSVPAQAIPCTAALLQRELGLADSGSAAFDLNATCLGFLAALDLIAQGMATQRYRTVMIVAAERASIGLRPSDSVTAGLFGDGAGAVILGRGDGHSALLASHFKTYSLGADLCQLRAGGSLLNPHTDPDSYLQGCYFEMRGRPLYRLVKEKMPQFIADLLGQAGLDQQGVDVWVPHQASGHGLDHMQRALGLPLERLVRTLETHGNQVSASLPIAFHHGIASGKIRRGSTVALVGTGAGLSLGGAVLRF
jgi:3-oxoacyl-[acyl-carrier-protein] synthase-3